MQTSATFSWQNGVFSVRRFLGSRGKVLEGLFVEETSRNCSSGYRVGWFSHFSWLPPPLSLPVKTPEGQWEMNRLIPVLISTQW